MKEEYIFTAATSGNFTVGGVDKIGGYKDEKIKTGKYTLSFSHDGIASSKVKKIFLSDDLLKKAQSSFPIRNYIVDNYIEVVSEKREPDAWVLSKASVTVRSTLEEKAIIDTLPSKLKCDDIIKWLSDAT
ncbi:MAG: hypothetical protein IKA10_03235 [Oscillospiraceae bacterium]|nr:hypothetical protein [Oscillospiraceae bacterium]